MLRKILYIVLLLSITTVSFAEKASSIPLAYETALIQAGEFDLFIPVLTSFSVDYIKKRAIIKKPFRIGKYEVTNDQWNQCYHMGGCSRPAVVEPNESGNHPVVRVNWHDAYQFSEWLSKTTGKHYRLPTEEEWIYAVYQGKEHKEVEEQYNYSDLNQISLIKKITKPVATFGGNDWGVFDSTGNVWEWTITCWYASEENILKETSAQHLNSPQACFTRVALGENRSHIPDFITDTYSGGCATLRPAANLGFRLVQEIH